MHFMHGVLKNLANYADRPIFKQYVQSGTGSPSWTSISYKECLVHLTNAAAHWQVQLTALGLQKKDVVGVWLTGSKYSDLLHIYAIIRAGFVPQIFHSGWVLLGGLVIDDTLRICKGKALLFDGSFSDLISNTAVPTCVIPDIESLRDVSASALDDLPDVEDEDVAMIFHTSGTTSGRPKPVPQTHRWLFSQSELNWPGAWQSKADAQKRFNNLGSFGHVGTGTALNYLTPEGQCIIQTSKPDFDADELLAMVRQQGLNNILLFGVWLSRLLAVARSSPDVLDALRNMQQISFTGEALNPEDARWVVEQKLPVVSIYGTTETAISLVSDLGRSENMLSLRLIEGMGCQFLPATKSGDLKAEGRENTDRIFDLFVPANAGNCPHPMVRNRPDGHITGDLFEEITSGYYIYRGRSDDWIKTGENRFFCDTKSIEDNVKLTCSDLIFSCIVIGSGKPAVVLFVEPSSNNTNFTDKELKLEIIRRTAPFNAKLYAHERIESPSRVVIAPPGSLPRTNDKGNIKRKEVERLYANVLEEIYSQI